MAPADHSARATLFLLIGRLSARLPPFRGRTRIALSFYRALRLEREHVRVTATLRRPVRFRAELDFRSWLQRIAFVTGGYEAETVEFLLRLRAARGSGGYLLDVGANVGLLAIPFAIMAATDAAGVVAVEAIPDNIDALRRNVALNGLEDRMTVLGVALGDEEKTAEAQVEGDLRRGEGTGTANILPDGSDYDCVRQQIPVERLDAVADDGRIPPGCAVMKIDTDGYDLKVLQGGTGFLRRERPVIFGEFSAHCMGWHGQSIADAVAFAAKNDYLAWPRVPSTWRFTARVDAAAYREDLLLVPAEARSRFEHLLAST